MVNKNSTLITLLTLLFFITSCKGQECDDTINFKPQNYSYKGYDIIPYGIADIKFPVGEEYIVYYWGGNYLSVPSKTVASVEKEDYYDSSFSIPVFDISGLSGDSKYKSFDFEEYLFLIKGIKQSKEQIHKELEISDSENNTTIQYNNVQYTIKRNIGKIYNEDEEAYTYKNVVFSLETPSHKQNILRMPEISNETTADLYYIGDIDEDSILDLIFRVIIRTEDGMSKNYYMLYLSSEAEEGQIMKHVTTRLYEYKMLEIFRDDPDSVD